MRFHLGSCRCGAVVQQRLEPKWIRSGDAVGRKKREGDRESEKERTQRKEREREKTQKIKRRERWERRERETPNTYALAQTTLKITIGCLCPGPSKLFQGAYRFSAHKKPAQRLDSLVRVSRRVEKTRKKTRACELVHHRRCS